MKPGECKTFSSVAWVWIIGCSGSGGDAGVNGTRAVGASHFSLMPLVRLPIIGLMTQARSD